MGEKITFGFWMNPVDVESYKSQICSECPLSENCILETDGYGIVEATKEEFRDQAECNRRGDVQRFGNRTDQ